MAEFSTTDPNDPGYWPNRAERLKADPLRVTEAAIERAAEAAHDAMPWVYGQDVDGEDVYKPWDEAPESVKQHYRDEILAALPHLVPKPEGETCTCEPVGDQMGVARDDDCPKHGQPRPKPEGVEGEEAGRG